MLLIAVADHDLHCLPPIKQFLDTSKGNKTDLFIFLEGVVGWCEGAVYLTSPGRPTDIGLQLGKACYPCSG